ncbi:hypothetical protein HDU97_001954 [Phlyctochytrium planicorne]|nr:hypothetical protein HDU97_001954 [Phlyctochytrium planicorne]
MKGHSSWVDISSILHINEIAKEDEEAQNHYIANWPILADFLEAILPPDPSQRRPVESFPLEELYRIVHDLCMHYRMTKSLGKDVFATINLLIRKQANALYEIHDGAAWLSIFARIVSMDRQAASTIRDVFIFLEKCQERMDGVAVDMKQEIMEAVYNHLIYPSERQLFQLIGSHTADSISMESALIVGMMEDLVHINMDCIAYNPELYISLFPELPQPPNMMNLRTKHMKVLASFQLNQARHQLWVQGNGVANQENRRDSKRTLNLEDVQVHGSTAKAKRLAE